ncbi:hypothetical protein CCR85_09140 [Rhodothalassium salexigens]|nr:hypothetical protein [Rhodothalassium salexigens]MBK5920943.1 hypothetical protein [Rhodothalassium salexigens]
MAMTDGRAGRAVLAVATLAALAGCVGEADTSPAPAAGDAATPAAAGGVAGAERVGMLPAQTLPAGECGLFLWPKQVNARLLLFSLSGEATARLMLDGRERTLPRTAAEGPSYYGQFLRQTFAGDGFEVAVRLVAEPGQGVVNGALVRRASVRVVAEDGWRYVLPAAGLIACEPPD